MLDMALPDQLENRRRHFQKIPFWITPKCISNIQTYIQVYAITTKIYQDIQARLGPGATGRRRGRAGRGGSAAALYFVYLNISLHILDIFLVYCKVKFSGRITKTF